tara:strand:- start:299 stop:412 length:114 start_codon:yes stop_codon:yes gene_type:complete
LNHKISKLKNIFVTLGSFVLFKMGFEEQKQFEIEIVI